MTITYFDDMSDPGSSRFYNELSNTSIKIGAPFSTDFSNMKVEGKGYTDGNNYIDIDFTMDDMRDVEAYKVLTY